MNDDEKQTRFCVINLDFLRKINHFLKTKTDRFL